MRKILAGLAATLSLVFGPGVATAGDGAGLLSFSTTADLNAWSAAHTRQDPPPEECPPEWEVCPGYGGDEDEVVITGSRIQAAPITNVQEAGVDEGDIVKMWGDILIILRRGRVFTVDTANGGLRPVDWIDAFPPGASPDDYDWFDEMLVVDGWVVVIGYSYAGEGSDIVRFRLTERGDLTHVDSHRLSSDDYYSSRNYASRLIGERLVVYTPQYFAGGDFVQSMPTLSRLRGGTAVETRPIARPEDVHVDGQPGDADDWAAIHTVTSCDLTARDFACGATAVVGPAGRSFYVSGEAVYLWLTRYRPQSQTDGQAVSSLDRIPLDGSRPQAVETRGAPVDQFSFEEDAEAGLIHVMVVSRGGGDAMWRPEFAEDAAALLSLPLSRFDEGRQSVRDSDYRFFQPAPDNVYRLHNRFVGDHLLFTAGSSAWYGEPVALLTIVPLDGSPETRLIVSGATERIEVLGQDALLVSRTDDVIFRTIALEPNAGRAPGTFAPGIVDTYVLPEAQGAESRSHAFFYQPDPVSADGEYGVLGLPVIRDYEETDLDFYQAADMAFLRRGNDRLRLMGTLDSRPDLQRDDRCVVSCIDWYGDARPIFVGDRIFALLGYELVEGRPDGRGISELQRVNFASVLPIH